VFDFDGLIADTETPEFESWCAEFREHGVELDIDEWIKCVGAGPSAWDVFDHLESLLGAPYDRAAVAVSRRERFLSLTKEIGVMPGVRELLGEARSEGVPCAVASSSEGGWVNGYLARFGLVDAFQAVVTRDMVALPKPSPDLYLEACSRLGVEVDCVVALEDSVNGVNSARAAGLYCIAVPNQITSRFDLSHADHLVESLSRVRLETVRELLAT
jgi:HAD superfamily hydrolase (TIGR01509 family)